MKTRMIRLPFIIIALMILPSTAVVAGEIFDPSWSLDFALEPQKTQIAGKSLASVNSMLDGFELTHIEPINCQNNVLTARQCQQVADMGGQFEMLLDANQDGRLERWSIAVGKIKHGGYSKILLVQDDASGEILQLLQLKSETPSFSALNFQQGRIIWAMCLSCDVFADIAWQPGGFQITWRSLDQQPWPSTALAGNNYVIP